MYRGKTCSSARGSISFTYTVQPSFWFRSCSSKASNMHALSNATNSKNSTGITEETPSVPPYSGVPFLQSQLDCSLPLKGVSIGKHVLESRGRDLVIWRFRLLPLSTRSLPQKMHTALTFYEAGTEVGRVQIHFSSSR